MYTPRMIHFIYFMVSGSETTIYQRGHIHISLKTLLVQFNNNIRYSK